jgi:hypothetical protein
VTNRKELLRAYKQAPPPMGVYAVRNTVEGKALVGASPNVAGRLNRERFSLEFGNNLSKPLQADWNRLGANAFTFEVLDTLEPSDDPEADTAADLAELLGMWLDRLGLPAEKRYPAG